MVDFSDLAASRGVAVAEAVGRLALSSGSALRPFLPYSRHAGLKRWATVAAFIAMTGCSTGDTQYPAQDAAAKQAATEAAKTSGEAAAAQAAPVASGAAASAAGSVPDINSVPKSPPVPADLEAGVQPGLSADRTNAQYTDEALMAPGGSAARPVAPAPVAATPPAPTQPIAAQPVGVPAGTPAPQVAGVSQQPLAPAVVGQYQAPQMTPLGSVSQGYVGTPQPGSKPFGGGAPAAGYVVQPGAVPMPSAPTVVATPVMVDYSSVAAGGTYGYASYSPYQRHNPAQAYYRSPYGVTQPVAYGGAALPQAPFVAPGYRAYAPAVVPPLPVAGQPVGVVFFNNGSSKLGRDDQRVVKQIAEMHRYYGGVIRIVGHASQRTGNMNPYAQDQVNYEVSMKRANSIARALTRRGVPAGLIQVAAAGSTTPIAMETMPAGEANNRRVEIYLSAY
jgi:outer membrane protein OmpA-like peptidoglycan-associated protein